MRSADRLEPFLVAARAPIAEPGSVCVWVSPPILATTFCQHGGDATLRRLTDDRRYSEEETALVLRRLGEMQVPDASAALTRSEIEQVAREAGLDVAHMDTALAEIETGGKRSAHLLGMRLFVVASRTVPGQLTPEKLQAAVALINRSIGVIGEYEINGDALTWFGRQIAVSVTSTGPNISIQIQERFHNTARGRLGLGLSLSMPASFGIFVALAEAIDVLALGVAAAVPVAALGAVRLLHRRRIDTTEDQLDSLAQQLAKLLRE